MKVGRNHPHDKKPATNASNVLKVIDRGCAGVDEADSDALAEEFDAKAGIGQRDEHVTH